MQVLRSFAVIVSMCLVVLAGATLVGARTSGVTGSSCEPAWQTVASANHTQFDRNHLAGISAHADDDALAVGFSDSDTGPGPVVLGEHWDGTKWSLLTMPKPHAEATLGDVHYVGADDALAVGEMWNGSSWRTLVERWNGSSFVPVTTPNGSTASGAINLLDDVGGTLSDTWAVGTVSTSALARPLILHWNGSTWTKAAVPADPGSGSYETLSVTRVSSSLAWAAGWYDNGTRDVPMLLRWNGTSWSVVGGVPKPGTGDAQLLSVYALSSKNAWAVGYDTEHADTRTLILHYDGSTWSRVSSPSGPSQNALRGVTARTGQDAWAVGFTNDAGAQGTADSLILHWDGTSWRQVSSPSPAQDSDLFAVDTVTGGSDVWAAGEAGWSFTARICPVRVSDADVEPGTANVDVGSSVAWAFPVANTLSHSVTDDSGLGLFDSGPRSPGGSYVHTFVDSGTHEIIDTATGHLSSIGVVPTSDPATGGTATDFLVTWATKDSASPYTHDVEVQGPTDGSYLSWQQGTTAGSGTFVPDQWQGGEGAGTYLVRARLRDTTTGGMTDWSPPVTITVS
jgi:hypothetical protein